jgi:hypothetical protein
MQISPALEHQNACRLTYSHQSPDWILWTGLPVDMDDVQLSVLHRAILRSAFLSLEADRYSACQADVISYSTMHGKA